jgi:hypothetical protein
MLASGNHRNGLPSRAQRCRETEKEGGIKHEKRACDGEWVRASRKGSTEGVGPHLSLLPGVQPHPRRIIHHNQAEPERHRKERPRDPVHNRHRGRERNAERRVGRRHAPRGDQLSNVEPAFLVERCEDLERLSERPGDECGHESRVPAQRVEKLGDGVRIGCWDEQGRAEEGRLGGRGF